jgi:hypothetical protein
MAFQSPKKPSKPDAVKPEGRGDLPTIFSVKGTPQFNKWLTDLSHHIRSTRAGAFDRAMAELAAGVGFRPPPIRLELGELPERGGKKKPPKR